MGPYPFSHGEPAMMRSRRRDAGISMVLVIVIVVLTLIVTVLAVIFWSNCKDAERSAAALKAYGIRLTNEAAEISAQLARTNEPTGLPLGEESRLSAAKANETMKKWRDEYNSASALDNKPLYPPPPGWTPMNKNT